MDISTAHTQSSQLSSGFKTFRFSNKHTKFTTFNTIHHSIFLMTQDHNIQMNTQAHILLMNTRV